MTIEEQYENYKEMVLAEIIRQLKEKLTQAQERIKELESEIVTIKEMMK